MNALITILIGAFVGWLASLIMKTDRQQGALLNIIVGILGALISGWLFGDILGFGSAIFSGTFSLMGIFWATVGAVIVIAIVRFFGAMGERRM